MENEPCTWQQALNRNRCKLGDLISFRDAREIKRFVNDKGEIRIWRGVGYDIPAARPRTQDNGAKEFILIDIADLPKEIL